MLHPPDVRGGVAAHHGLMNTSILNYQLATARTADIERGARHLQVREPAERRRRGFAAGGRARRAALVARLIG
jgi:hypothetical protein